MAKVMISMPDDLLERLDARARELGETRSGLLQRLVEREVEAAESREQKEINRLLDQLRALPPGKQVKVDAAQLVREDRESH
ncbi:MAG TPA: ribbon-helix-helix protein, CopG family [Solirubrobacterales bacterium]|nr:ribbon-helix-helix protein, CopG family [Solirubrobacterales bacterium]